MSSPSCSGNGSSGGARTSARDRDDAVSKLIDSWHSSYLDREVTVARWGDVGRPVLMFPTAGGDAEEIERFHVVDACSELIAAGRIRLEGRRVRVLPA